MKVMKDANNREVFFQRSRHKKIRNGRRENSSGRWDITNPFYCIIGE